MVMRLGFKCSSCNINVEMDVDGSEESIKELKLDCTSCGVEMNRIYEIKKIDYN